MKLQDLVDFYRYRLNRSGLIVDAKTNQVVDANGVVFYQNISEFIFASTGKSTDFDIWVRIVDQHVRKRIIRALSKEQAVWNFDVFSETIDD